GPTGFTRSFDWTRWGMSASAQWPVQHSELRGMLYGSVFLAGDSTTTFAVAFVFFLRSFSSAIFFTTCTGTCSKWVRGFLLAVRGFMTGTVAVRAPYGSPLLRDCWRVFASR